MSAYNPTADDLAKTTELVGLLLATGAPFSLGYFRNAGENTGVLMVNASERFEWPWRPSFYDTDPRDALTWREVQKVGADPEAIVAAALNRVPHVV